MPEGSPVIKILKSDHSEDMQEDIKGITRQFYKTGMPHKDLASAIKCEWDRVHPPTDNKATSGVYHCIAGTNFAVCITHETRCATYWSCDNVKLLLFKSKDSPFD